MSSRPARWWARLGPERPAARARLVCFPHAGGSDRYFRPWSAHLPADLELWGLQLPGRDARLREPLLESVEAVLEALPPLDASPSGLPTAYLGHSMGALIAFALTRRQAARGEQGPAHLFVAGFRAPQRERPQGPPSGANDAELISWLRRQGGVREELLDHAELMAIALPILRADLRLIDAYRHEAGPPLACGVTALAGTRDALAPPEAMSPWAELTTGPFRLEVIEGDHFFLMQSPAEVVTRLVAALNAALP